MPMAGPTIRRAMPLATAGADGARATRSSGTGPVRRSRSGGTGSTSKILHGGWGAHSGIVALDLATAGITGPSTVFEGKFGFFETHVVIGPHVSKIIVGVSSIGRIDGDGFLEKIGRFVVQTGLLEAA